MYCFPNLPSLRLTCAALLQAFRCVGPACQSAAAPGRLKVPTFVRMYVWVYYTHTYLRTCVHTYLAGGEATLEPGNISNTGSRLNRYFQTMCRVNRGGSSQVLGKGESVLLVHPSFPILSLFLRAV